MFYRKSWIPHAWEQPCSDYGRERTCRDGVLDGGEPYGPTGELFDEADCEVEQVTPVLTGPMAERPWQLVWSDEFARDKDLWDYQDGTAWIGGYRVPENSTISDGLLRITNHRGSREPHPPQPQETSAGTVINPSTWESAHLRTKRGFTYGLFEARLRYSGAESIDNAFWLMTAGVGLEIDIVEGFWWADNSDQVDTSLHMREPGVSGDVVPAISNHTLVAEDLAASYHVYSAAWTESEIVWFLDGEEIFRVDEAEHLAFYRDQSLLIRLSTAVSDIFSAGGVPDEADGTAMIVDYVRVYQEP